MFLISGSPDWVFSVIRQRAPASPKTMSKSDDFSSDFIASIDQVLATTKQTQPMDQLCFIWQVPIVTLG